MVSSESVFKVLDYLYYVGNFIYCVACTVMEHFHISYIIENVPAVAFFHNSEFRENNLASAFKFTCFGFAHLFRLPVLVKQSVHMLASQSKHNKALICIFLNRHVSQMFAPHREQILSI